MEIHPRVVFDEPRGRRTGLTFLSASFVCLLGWVYFGLVLEGPHVLLFIGIAFALSGVAESMPANRRRLAGVLRIGAVALLVGFLILLATAPDVVFD